MGVASVLVIAGPRAPDLSARKGLVGKYLGDGEPTMIEGIGHTGKENPPYTKRFRARCFDSLVAALL